MNNTDLNFLIDRIYKLEETNRGFTTRIKLLEADVNKLIEIENKRL